MTATKMVVSDRAKEHLQQLAAKFRRRPIDQLDMLLFGAAEKGMKDDGNNSSERLHLAALEAAKMVSSCVGQGIVGPRNAMGSTRQPTNQELNDMADVFAGTYVRVLKSIPLLKKRVKFGVEPEKQEDAETKEWLEGEEQK